MYLCRPPRHPLLKSLVERLWVFRSDGYAHAYERMLPRGRPQILFNLREDVLRVEDGGTVRLPGAVLEGPFDRAFVIDTRQQCAIAGVELSLGALGAWVEGKELTSTRIGLAELYRGDLRDRVLSARTDAGVLDRLEQILVETRATGPDRAMSVAAAALEGGANVGAVAKELGFGARAFRERFVRRLGLLPKRYARVRRLQRVLPLAAQGLDWGVVAHRTGYADQAHLCREFRALTGMAPSAYAPRSAGDLNHVIEPYRLSESTLGLA